MQLFGLHEDASLAAAALCDTHVRSQIRETTQILYTALWIWDVVPAGKVDCSAFGQGDRNPYKPFSPHHPIVQWAAACRAHFDWVMQHARALAQEHERRFGGKQLCEAFIEHLVAHIELHGAPSGMPQRIAHDSWLEGLEPRKRKLWQERVALVTPPGGCLFGIVALNDFDPSNPRDWVGSYSEYYRHKEREWQSRELRPIVMTWSKAPPTQELAQPHVRTASERIPRPEFEHS